MDMVAVWPAALEALRALGAHYGPAMDQTAAESGLPSPEWYGWLLPALFLEPDALSATRLRRRSPYTSARLYNERLAKATKQGFVTPVAEAEDEYRLTELGRQAAKRVIGAAYTKMAALRPMPTAELERVASLLGQLVKSCLTAPEPPGKWCLVHSQRIDPGDDAPVLVRIDQSLSDLGAYRDDAHLAAWQPHGLDGHAWEAFTYLWRGEATTLDGLYEKLEWRGISREEYGQALQDLEQCGWLQEEAGEYQVTAQGREIRQAAEDTTDRHFYAAWSCLSQGETEELLTLLKRLADGLRAGA